MEKKINGNNLFLIFLKTTFFLYGLFATGGQVTLIRELLVVHFGNELCIGIIFASWLLSISIGAWFGGRLSRHRVEPLFLYLVLLTGMTILLPLEIVLIRMLRVLLGIKGGELIPFSIMASSTFFLLFPLSFFIGLIFPFGSRSMEKFEGDGARGIGWIYLLEAMGSGVGGAMLTYWMLSRFSSLQIASIFATILLFFTILTGYFGLPSKRRLICLFSGFLLFHLIPYISGVIQILHGWSINMRWKGFNPEIILVQSVDSVYQNIEIGRLGSQYSLYGNGQLMETFPDEHAFEILAHLVLNQHPMPKKVLLIGGGIGGLLKYMLKYPLGRLDYVEIDPAMIHVSMAYLSSSEKEILTDKRLRLYFTDGRHFIKRTREKYDLVFINLPDPSTAMINRFYTLEFFHEARKALSPKGVIALSLSSAENYIGEAVGNYAGSIFWTLRKVFPFVLATPGERTFMFASSSSNSITSDHRILANRFIERGISADHFTPDYYEMILSPSRIQFTNKALEAHRDLPINSDWQPISYFYNLVLWHLFSGKKHRGSFLAGLAGMKPWWLMVMIFSFLAMVLAIMWKRRDKSKYLALSALFAISTTGFAGMSLEIIMIFSFQNIFGYIYREIGIMVSLFMIGLSSGCLITNRIMTKKERDWPLILLGVEGAICLFAFFLSGILRAFFGGPHFHFEAPFFLLVGVAGFFAGLEFPLVGKILIANGHDTGDAAGKVDSLDHLGASIGGAITGTFFVPILGIDASCAIVGSLKIASTILIVVSIKRVNL